MLARFSITVVTFMLSAVGGSRLAQADTNTPLALPPPPTANAPAPPAVTQASAATPARTLPAGPVAADQTNSPNQALADMAKEAVLKSLKPEYDKQENWGHQKDIVDGFHWTQRADGWHWEKQTKKVNEGTWRSYRVRLDNPERNLQLRFTPPQAAANGATAFQAFLTARLWADAVQEQWLLGVKGFNLHIEGYVTVQARLDIVVAVQPVAGASFGTIEVLPQVTSVGLQLEDLTLTKVDLLHGDAARELGRMLKDIVAAEVRKREPEVAAKINAQIQKHRDKLQFSPSQIAQIGWTKIQALLGGTSSPETSTAKAKP
jgi:hypothetical protein